jgi:hypothetical protein
MEGLRLIRSVLLGSAIVFFGWHGSAEAGTFQIYNPPAENAVINPGIPGEGNVLQATSDTSPGHSGYGGMFYRVTTPALTFDSLTQLSALYQMTTGTFGGGAPRFTLFDSSTNGAANVFWGNPQPGGTFADPHSGAYASTGNLADPLSTDARFSFNTTTFGSKSVTTNVYYTYAQFSALVGTEALSFITLDLDGGFTGKQVMITDEFTVGTATSNEVFEAGPDLSAVPEPATLSMLGIGAVGLLGFASRRRRKAAA